MVLWRAEHLHLRPSQSARFLNTLPDLVDTEVRALQRRGDDGRQARRRGLEYFRLYPLDGFRDLVGAESVRLRDDALHRELQPA